ncbi:1,4-beta-xylanase, partial [bacterium]|nr:1,4-beta-xylanase [bacterium]
VYIRFIILFFVPFLTLPIHAVSLRGLAEQHTLWVGAAVSGFRLKHDAEYRSVLAREYNMLVAENDMKFHRTHPKEDTYTFVNADAIANFAQKQGMKLRGHTLVWHRAVPDWLEEKEWKAGELSEMLREHILKVAGRYKGQMHAWDVVNEAMTNQGEWRDSFWYKHLGKDYLFNAFRWAKQADPEAKLFYNDYSAAVLNKKSDAIYDLVKEMQGKGIPIDGIGFQLHVKAAKYPNIASMRKNIRRLAALGMEVHFTEIDARLKLPTTKEQFEQQARCYRELLELCLSEPNCKAFLTWGFTDRYSWVYKHFEGYGDALPFDKNYEPKPAYHAMIDVLRGASGRN